MRAMPLAQLFDWAALALIAACIVVWPTQWISDTQNRWLRIAAIGSVAAQLLVAGPHFPLIPAYFVAALFVVLLVLDRRRSDESSAVRERHEGALKKAVRWTLILSCAGAWLASVVLLVLHSP
jgi:hypothetical protein